MKLLTIAIPTYNRAHNLELLLLCLHAEVRSLRAEVAVIVSDNASSDDTQRVLLDAQADWPELLVHRNEENIGADSNFCGILDRIDTRYFWLLGDDDLPKSGVIPKLVAILERDSPALLYMQSEWVNPIIGPRQGSRVDRLRVEALDRAGFASRVHVWCTFISGMVIDHQQLLRSLGENTVRRFTGTNLVQLGWVYPVLGSASKFFVVHDACVLATKDNTGGYGLLAVFGTNFARVSREAFDEQPAIAKALIRGNLMRYLPNIIWLSRTRGGDRFSTDNPWPAMQQELGKMPLFWALLVPLGKFPKFAAMPFFQTWRVVNRIRRELDQWATQRRGVLKARR